MKKLVISILLIAQILIAGCAGESNNSLIKENNAKGYSLFQQKKNKESIAYFNKSIEIDPNYVETYSLRAMPYIELRDYKKAEKDLKFSISNKDEGYNRSSDYYKMFVLYSRQGKFDQAFDYLKKSLKITRGSFLKRFFDNRSKEDDILPKHFIRLYGEELIKNGNVDSAHEVFLVSTKYYPNYYFAYSGLAYIEEKHYKNKKKANKYKKKAKKLAEGHLENDSKLSLDLIKKSIVDQ